MRKIAYALLSVLIVSLTLLGCKIFTEAGMDTWYPMAQKPMFTPPDYVFPIAWSIIYAMLILTAYRIFYYRLGSPIIVLFIIQQTLQVLWCMVFFGMQNYLMGLMVLLMLDLTVLILIFRLQNPDIISARLMYPYFIWLLFATYLNLGFIF